MVTGNLQYAQFSPKDVFYGQLAGMLEALTAGTTTVIDHAHVNVSPAHAKLGIAGTASSVKSFNPLTIHANPLEDWVMETFSELADQATFSDGRVTLGFAWDLWFLGAETHVQHHTNIKTFGLLDKCVVISHGGDITKNDAQLIREAGAHLSVTPSTELQTGLGQPLCFDAAFSGGAESSRVGVQNRASLGIDCHSNNAKSVIFEARLGLQNARGSFNDQYLSKGKMARRLPSSLSVEAAFNLATIQGAKAASFDNEIGRIAEGYRADLVLFDALSPAMLAATQHDPVAAIIQHSSPADIDMVMVDGVVRKRDGKLVDVNVDEGAREIVGKEKLGWGEVTKEILRSRERIQPETEKVDVEQGIEVVMGM